MPSTPVHLNAAQQDALGKARIRLQQARSLLPGNGLHRSLLRTGYSFGSVFGIVLMAALPCAALWALRMPLMDAWHNLLFWWAERLELPLAWVTLDGVRSMVWAGGKAQLPSELTLALTAIAVLLAWAATARFSDRMMPLKYLVRVLCGVQATALVFFALLPGRFAYTLSGYLSATLDAGFFLMLVLPILLALGWGVLRLPVYQKVLYPALLLVYFAVMVPHKALLHLLVLQEFSVLFMPMLYLCLGAVLDLMIFVALYAWLASHAPVDAMADHA